MEQNKGPRNKPTHLCQLIHNKVGKNMQWRNDSLFNKWFWENWTGICKWMKLEHFLNTINKNKLRPKHKNGFYKVLRGKCRQNTLWHKSQKCVFFGLPPRVMKIKANINKWDLIKLKTFAQQKETINKMKRQPTEWEKNLTNQSDWQEINL